jgi:hypothetical protein
LPAAGSSEPAASPRAAEAPTLRGENSVEKATQAQVGQERPAAVAGRVQREAATVTPVRLAAGWVPGPLPVAAGSPPAVLPVRSQASAGPRTSQSTSSGPLALCYSHLRRRAQPHREARCPIGPGAAALGSAAKGQPQGSGEREKERQPNRFARANAMPANVAARQPSGGT